MTSRRMHAFERTASLGLGALRAGSRHARRFLLDGWRRAAASPALRGAAAALFLGSLIAGLGVAALAASVVRVPAGSVGVRQGSWSVSGGLASADLAPGLHLAPRGWAHVHELDARLQLARFGFESEGATSPPLELRTPDGNTSKVHVEVLYRLRPGGAHRLVAAGLKSAWRGRVEARIEEVLADGFARLASDELMRPEALAAASVTARAALAEELAALEVEPLNVLVSGVWFPAPFEAELRDKQLEGQAIRTDGALARRARVKTENALAAHALEAQERSLEWELERAIASLRLDLEARIAQETRRATDGVHALELEAEEGYRDALAEGESALAEAQARREELIARALDGPGARALVAHELAEDLRFEHIELDGAGKQGSPLDLDRWVDLLLGTDAIKPAVNELSRAAPPRGPWE